jgi:hypothetical protein
MARNYSRSTFACNRISGLRPLDSCLAGNLEAIHMSENSPYTAFCCSRARYGHVRSVGASRSRSGVHRILSGATAALAIFGPMARSFQLEALRDRTRVRPSLCDVRFRLVLAGFGPRNSRRACRFLLCAAACAMVQPRDTNTDSAADSPTTGAPRYKQARGSGVGCGSATTV